MATEQQYEDQLRPAVAHASNKRQATFIFIAAEADALVEGESQFGMCMKRSGWVKRKVESAAEQQVAANDVWSRRSRSLPIAEPQTSTSHPAAPLEEASMQGGGITVKNTRIMPKTWRENPQGKVPDTLTFIDNNVSVYSDGSIFVKVMMNYDEPSKLLFIGATQSVLFNVALRCDYDKATARRIEFYAGKDATGELLKSVSNTTFRIKPNSVESRMQSYVCSAVAGRR